MSETYDTIEIAIPIHSRDEERKLDRVRAELSDMLEAEHRQRRLVTIDKAGELPEMEVTIRCYLTNGGRSWKKVRRLLSRAGILELNN